MNYLIDIIIISCLILGFYRGFKKGFFDEISYLLSLVFSIYSAIHLSYYFKIKLEEYFKLNHKYNSIIAFFTMLIVIVIVMALISKVFSKIETLIKLGKTSNYLGGLLASLKFLLLLGIMFNWLESVTFMLPVFNQQQKETSILFNPTKQTADIVFPKLLDKLEDLKNLEQDQRERQEKEIQDKEYYQQQKEKYKTFKF